MGMNRVLLVPLAAIAFSLSSPATIVALRTLSVPTVVFGRCLVAGLVLAPWLFVSDREKSWCSRQRGVLRASAAGALLALHLVLFVAGLAGTSYAAVVALVALEPLAVLLVGMIGFGDRPSRAQLAGLSVAIFGTLVVGLGAFSGGAGGGAGAELRPHRLAGDLEALAAVVLFGLYFGLNKSLAPKQCETPHSDLRSAAVTYLAASVTAGLLAAPGWIFGSAQAPGAGSAWEAAAAIAVLGLVPTLVGHTTSQMAARRLPPIVAGLIAPGETVGSLFIGFVAFGARPSSAEAVGAALILGGAVLVTASARSSKLAH